MGVAEEQWPQLFLQIVRQDLDVSETARSYEKYNDWLKEKMDSDATQVGSSWLEPNEKSGVWPTPNRMSLVRN